VCVPGAWSPLAVLAGALVRETPAYPIGW
jgi:hypothetical protein